jgi:DNA repair exonuclease SbcCD ATPase subunit
MIHIVVRKKEVLIRAIQREIMELSEIINNTDQALNYEQYKKYRAAQDQIDDLNDILRQLRQQ